MPKRCRVRCSRTPFGPVAAGGQARTAGHDSTAAGPFRILLAILREEERAAGRRGDACLFGSPEIARECIRLGLAIGVAGTVTTINAVRPLEVVRKIPLEHLLLETDAPDLTPEPHTGEGERTGVFCSQSPESCRN